MSSSKVKKKKVTKPKQEGTRNGGRWTEGRYRGFVTSTLRGGFRRWGPKYDALKLAYVGRKVNTKSGREANHYKCAGCSKDYPQSGVQVDHREPIGSCKSWDEFISKLFCEVDNLQILCKNCHKTKTKKDNNKKNED